MYKRYYDIDVDAKAYANNIVKAGGRIPSDINSVSDFIRRLKQNNLYNSVANMWFLRSNQNVDFGSTFYPLKGLNNPCILINGPTIGQNGIRTSNSSSQYLRIITPDILDDFTVCVVGANIAPNTGNRIFSFQRASTAATSDSVILYYVSSTLLLTLNYTNAGTSTATDGLYPADSLAFQSFAISAGPRGSSYRRNATINSTLVARTPRPQMKNVIYCGGFDNSGTNSPTNFSNFIYSAVFLFSPSVNDNFTTIYNIYKSTAGKGLGLP